jgi:DNA-binding response OmpR family regulator
MSDAAERRLLDPEAHLLVVEDDGEMRNLVARLLREAGFRVSAARDGREMWEIMASPAGAPDLVLLDVMLPGASGLDLLRKLRERGRIPVMMLTARGEEMDRVLGLELGADDYVAKPFAPRELVARVRALLRRAERGGARSAIPPDCLCRLGAGPGAARAGFARRGLRRSLRRRIRPAAGLPGTPGAGAVA